MPTTITGLTMSSTGLTITCPTGITFGYIPYTGVCETVQNFEIRKTITGLWGPTSLWFDSRTSDSYGTYPNGRVWVADYSNTNGNIYWFDPVTATTSSHMHYILGGTGQPILETDTFYQTYIDSTYKRIYFVGYNGSASDSVYGMVLYDMSTNTVIHYHDNGNTTTSVDKRQLLYVTNDNIYVNTDNSIINYPRNSSIPSTSGSTPFDCTNTNGFPYKHFCGGSGANDIYGAFNFTQISASTINSPVLWVTACPSNGGNIGVISTDLNTTYTDISLPGQLTWANSEYWQFSFYDQKYNKFYVSDAGSNKYYIVTPSLDNKSGTVQTFSINKLYLQSGGVTYDYVLIGWTIDPQSGKLYANYNYYNGTNTTSLAYNVFELNRTNGSIIKRLPLTQSIGNLQPVNDGNQYSLMGSNPSRTNGSGSVTILNNTTNTGYTGLWDVKTMEAVDPTHNNIPVGIFTPTAYTITNKTVCSITQGYTCPTCTISYDSSTFYYDFNLSQDVLNTTNIYSISYSAVSHSGPGGSSVPISANTINMSYFSGGTSNTIYYYSGTFPLSSSSPPSPYYLNFEYKNSSGIVLSGCTSQ